MITTLMDNYNKNNEKAEGFEKVCDGEACYRNSLWCYKKRWKTMNYKLQTYCKFPKCLL